MMQATGFKFRTSVTLVCFPYIAALACMPLAAFAAETEREEYQPLLDVNSLGDETTDGLPDGWALVSGDTWTETAAPVPEEHWSVRPSDMPGMGAALCVSAPSPNCVVSPPLPVDPGLQALSGGVTAVGDGDADVYLLWLGRDATLLERVVFRAAPTSPGSIRRFNLSESVPPAGATTARLALVSHPAESYICWQTARLAGRLLYTAEAQVLFNRVGYDMTAPKQFTLRSNFPVEHGRFTLTDNTGVLIHEAALGDGMQMGSAGAGAWEGYYYSGDFSTVLQEGTFTLSVYLDDLPPLSEESVRIGFNLLWEAAFAAVLMPFRTHRAEAAGAALALWNDTGLNAAPDAELLWLLTRSWSLLRGRFPDDPPLKMLEEEVLYGGGRVADRVLAGHELVIQDREDGIYYLNALTCIARALPDKERFLKAAQRLMEAPMTEGRAGGWYFTAAMDLYEATQEAAYLDYAKSIYPGLFIDRLEPLLNYEGLTGEQVTVDAIQAFDRMAGALVRSAENPFGLAPGPAGFFVWEEASEQPLLGNSARLLESADLVAQAYRYMPKREYLTYVHRQFDWLLGNNPFGVCLVSGMCAKTDPPVVRPDGFGSADVVGAVLHGIGPADTQLDVPRFAATPDMDPDETTNGYSLYNNARYISAMAYLKRIPIARPGEPR